MSVTWTLCALAVSAIFVHTTIQAQVPSESCSPTCGFYAVCENSTCTCQQDYVLHGNGKDCRNASCTSLDCLQCEAPNRCARCESFISVSTGLCLKKCQGSAEMKNDSLICTESKNNDGSGNIVIAVVSGVACGAALCIIVIAAVCFYIRKTRRNINLQNKDYTNRQMESGLVKQFPVYVNNAYETDNQTVHMSGKVDPLEYASELDKLRPYADTLMTLLSQVRSKTRAMDTSDERVPTYKGVIHQLCRVLVLVHKRDPVVSIPSDAIGLIQWAHQMLEDHRELQNSSDGCSPDFPIAQISSVDLDFDNSTFPEYATPERNLVSDSAVSSLQVASPYSTVPIPISEIEQQHHYGTGKRPGFATISRARAKPNSDLIRALETDQSNTGTFSISQDPITVSPYQNSGFRREDLQNFLIHSGEKSDFRNNFDHNVNNAQLASGKPTTANNPGDQPLNFELKEKLKNRINKAQHMSPAQTLHPDTSGSQQSTKKNIITNPNANKKSSSPAGKQSKYATPSLGYFANGHYYDPNPMPNPDAEVYAPGSSYSDHSNVMSTFLGDLPRSSSNSEQSEDGDDESENSGGDLDVFPFDPKDCTEPVEV